MPQPPRDTWEVEIVSQRTESGIVLFEYVVRERGGEPFLLNNHRAQIRTDHQRVKRDGDGKLLHVSGVAVAADDDFMETDSRAYRWVDKDLAGNWRDDRSRTLAPYIFPTALWAGGQDEELDPQWQREQFVLALQPQVDDAIQRFLDRAEAKGWTGDRRGTALNIKIGAGANDAMELDDGTGFDGTANFVDCNANATAGSRWNAGLRFPGVTIPNAATINTATLKVWFQSTLRDDIDAEMLCEDVDNAANFTDTADVTSRARTGVGATWVEDSMLTAGTTSPDFASAPQTVVNRGSWASGNAMVAFLDGLASATELTRIESYEGNTAEAAEIDIDYTAAGATRGQMLTTLGVS